MGGWAGWAGWAGSMLGGVLGEVTPPSSFTRRSAGSAARHSRQARRPAVALAAGSVAASMARRCPNQSTKMGNGICPNRLGEPAVRRACTWADAAPGHRGHCRHTYEAAERGAQTQRGRTLTERPRNPAVQAGFKAHVRSRAKCMPVAPQRGQPTRTKRPFSLRKKPEASHPHFTRPPSTRTPSPVHRTSPSATGRVASPAAPAGRPEAAGRPPSARRAPNTPP